MRASIALISLLFLASAKAQVNPNVLDREKPKYELGVGVIGLNSPDYPGARDARIRVIPVPYYIYRGDIIRMDEDGNRARVNKDKRYELGLSFGFNFAVDSSKVAVREGMPNLDTLLETGPRILFRLIRDNKTQKLNLSFAIRSVFATNFSSRFFQTGFNYGPSLRYWKRWNSIGTTLFSGITSTFGSAKINDYYFSVDQQFATADRPTYKAKAGLIENAISLGFMQSITPRLVVFCGGSFRNIKGSANEDSPLIERDTTLSAAMGFIWRFYESEEKG